MQEHEFLMAVRDLEAYPRFNIAETSSIWCKYFQGKRVDVLQRTTERWVRTQKYAPTISELLAAYKEQVARELRRDSKGSFYMTREESWARRAADYNQGMATVEELRNGTLGVFRVPFMEAEPVGEETRFGITLPIFRTKIELILEHISVVDFMKRIWDYDLTDRERKPLIVKEKYEEVTVKVCQLLNDINQGAIPMTAKQATAIYQRAGSDLVKTLVNQTSEAFEA